MSFLVPVSIQRSQCENCGQYRGINPDGTGMEEFAGKPAFLVNCLLAEAADSQGSQRGAILEVVARVKQAVGPCTATQFVEDPVKWEKHFD